MSYYELVHEETTGPFLIELHTAPEDSAPDWDFENEDDRAEAQRRIDDGSLLWFIARVRASVHGVTLGESFLGGCCYDSIADFIKGGYYEDMKEEVIETANNKVASIAIDMGIYKQEVAK